MIESLFTCVAAVRSYKPSSVEFDMNWVGWARQLGIRKVLQYLYMELENALLSCSQHSISIRIILPNAHLVQARIV